MPEGNMFIEKRKHKRATVSYTVKYKLMPKDSSMEALKKEGKSTDLSAGGVRVEGLSIGTTGDVIKVEFKTDQKEEPIVAFAEIKWQRKQGNADQFGLEFLALKEEDKEIINKIIEE